MSQRGRALWSETSDERACECDSDHAEIHQIEGIVLRTDDAAYWRQPTDDSAASRRLQASILAANSSIAARMVSYSSSGVRRSNDCLPFALGRFAADAAGLAGNLVSIA